MIRHLLIDLDGTLIHHSDKIMAQLRFTARLFSRLKQGKKPQSWRTAWRTIRQGSRALMVGDTTYTNFERMIQVVQKNHALSQDDAKKLMTEAFDFAYPTLEKYFKPMPGAAEFIDWAKNHYTLTLATNPIWPIELVKQRMKWGNINPEHFKSITTFDRMHSCKPARSYYLEILKQENLKPEECIMIGNEKKMDLPATKAGIPVYLLYPRFKNPQVILESSSLSPQAWKGNFNGVKLILDKLRLNNK